MQRLRQSPLDTRPPLSKFRFLDIDRRKYGNDKELRQRHRINALCSLYYFGKYILNRKDLNTTFHKPLCDSMQRLNFKDLFRISRGHLKSTIASEMLPMWRTLRVLQEDIDFLLSLKDATGARLYDDDFIRYLLAVHRPDGTNILCSETKSLAVGLIKRIKYHYEQGQFFREVFNDLLPYSVFGYAGRLKGAWSGSQLTIQRDDKTISEPTFDAQGLNQSLQSKHVGAGGMVIEDDCTGKKCLKSPTINSNVIENHTLLGGLFYDDDKDHTGNQIVVANDWGPADLNTHIRKNETWFTVHTSGCLWCPVCKNLARVDLGSFKSFDATQELLCLQGHAMTPVFPEKYSIKKIHKEWQQMKSKAGGEYNFCAQYLNQPGSSSDAIFPSGWLKYYYFLDRHGQRWAKDVDGNKVNVPGRIDGYVEFMDEIGQIRRKRIADMNRYMIMDPSYGSLSNDACRAALPVTAIDDEGRKFLLEDWAKLCGSEILYDQANMFAAKWLIDVVYVEAAGAGRVIGHGLNMRNQLKKLPLRAMPIKQEGDFALFVQGSERPLSGQKEARIYNLRPTFETEFWCRKDQVDFLDEYKGFTSPVTIGVFVDILDALSYGPQIWETPLSHEDLMEMEVRAQMYLMEAERGIAYR